MSPRTLMPALLIAQTGTLEHNTNLVGRLRDHFDVSIRVYNNTGTTFVGRRELIRREASLLAALLVTPRSYRNQTIVICGSGHYAALALSKLLAVFGRDVKVFLFNFYLHRLGTNRVVRRVLSLLLTERILIIAQSPVDHDYFASLTSRAKVLLFPYRQGPVEGLERGDVNLGDYVFAGGYTNRDYDALIRCAQRLPEIRFLVVCSHLNRISENIPSNVEIQRDLEQDAFHRLLAGARLVVIPLAEDVGASGQMVTLAAMQLGKATVVADSPVVTQYIEHATTGIVYKLGSDDSLRESINAVYCDLEQLVRLGDAARDTYYRQFTSSALTEPLVGAIVAFAAG